MDGFTIFHVRKDKKYLFYILFILYLPLFVSSWNLVDFCPTIRVWKDTYSQYLSKIYRGTGPV